MGSVRKEIDEDVKVHDDGNARRLKAGKLLANPEVGEEVVITGMAGKFPNSNDIYEFRDNLFNKVDLCDDDSRRWEHNHAEIPKRSGKIYGAEKFDSEFFGIHQREVDTMDPLCRILLERMYESILDAGLHPDDLKGQRTGVFVGSCFSETEKHTFFDDLKAGGMGITGSNRSMQSHRMSYFLKLEGPSYVADTACSSSSYALEHAFRAMRTGKCDSAIVGGANLCLHPFLTLKFANLGVLSPEGVCKPFDENANGYTRSEAIAAIFLQKSKDAKRVYAKIIHAKLNVDGYKEQGITYPSGETQKELLQDVYDECGVPLDDVTYMEAHGTGTRVGDPEELRAIDEVFGKNRTRPLLIGSVKSSIGHTEPVSALCSVVKVLLGMEAGYIPPNINYNKARSGIEGLSSGRLQVVAGEKMAWPDRDVIAGINCFGFGGANSHILLSWNGKEKVNGGMPEDELPRLVCVSGRTPEAVDAILDDLTSRELDAEFVGLLHGLHRKHIAGHPHRGFSILSKSTGEIVRSSLEYSELNGPLYLICGSMDSTYNRKLQELLQIPLIQKTIDKAREIIISNKLPTTMVDVLTVNYSLVNKFVGNVIYNVCVVELFKELGIEYQVLLEHSMGELTKYYKEGNISFEQAILAAHDTAVLLQKFGDHDQIVLCAKLYNAFVKFIPVNEHAKYLSHNLLSTVDLTKDFNNIVHNSVVIKMGKPLTKDLMKVLDDRIPVVNFLADDKDCLQNTLQDLGRLYELGVDMNLQKLYPEVQFPVSRGTPMISPLIKWKHTNDFFITKYGTKSCSERKTKISTKDADNQFIKGHIIDGRNLYPATGYILLVWEAFSVLQRKMYTAMQIVFENVRFNRATNVGNDTLEFIVSIRKSTGDFEVSEGGFPIVTGRVYEVEDIETELFNLPIPASNFGKTLYEKDVYKELRLRGYNYKGLFRGIEEFRGCEALVQWRNNWVAFMDNLLQLQILQEDTRMLYVPTGIQRLVIDAKSQIKYAMSLEEDPVMPVHIYNDANIIRSKFVEIRGLRASSIPKRKPLGEPVLEKYQFVPNLDSLSLVDAVKINTHLIFENTTTYKIKIVELVNDLTDNKLEEIVTLIRGVFDDEPIMQADVTQIVSHDSDFEMVKSSGANLVVINELFKNQQIKEILAAVPNDAFIISKENLSFSNDFVGVDGFKIISLYKTKEEVLIMGRKTSSNLSEEIKYDVLAVPQSLDNFEWLQVLQEHLSTTTSNNLILLSQNEPLTGILGLTNCLRRELRNTGSNKTAVTCFMIQDEQAPNFNPSLPFYKEQLAVGLGINVLRDGKWGTYRHLALEDSKNCLVRKAHGFSNTTVRGDLSSIKWIEGPLNGTEVMDCGRSFIHIYYSAVNFRDVMSASGRINVDVFAKNRLEQECVQGFEFAGRERSGRRVMGMITTGALATMICGDTHFLWPVPDSWTMEEAATVPVVYGTVLYSFFNRTKLRPGQSVLIHSGTGGVGQAAINIALHYRCTVFTTVGTDEKRAFIRRNYPQIRAAHIGNSRDTSFEQMVLRETRGRGVDLVLNSLAEEKLQASVRCVAAGGSFIEIGKFDLASDNALQLELFAKGATFHGVMLDNIFSSDSHIRAELAAVISAGIAQGCVKPLPKTCFKRSEVEEAYRFMSTGKHIGKVIIRIKREETDKMAIPVADLVTCVPRFYCKAENSYILLGGLGGLGLELADWLVLRGARILILTSRTGIKTGYQDMRIKLWKSYGVNVLVLTDDITTKEGCTAIINKANNFGPVESIFNLAVILRDSIIGNQTVEDFKISFGPKPCTTKLMDQLTRTICPQLRDFVVFSSVSCGRGNAGQSNYGMANSIMERICEQRHREGLPAVAIQWGAIGDVGLVAEHMAEDHGELVIGGTLQQRVSSCLEVLDRFLRQREPVVASMVVAEKKTAAGGAGNMVDAVVNILGLRDLKTVSLHSTLPELGMDSMMAVEIKQTLEREYEMFLTPQDIRGMTFARLQEMSNEENTTATTEEGDKLNEDEAVQFILNFIGNEELSRKPLVQLTTKLPLTSQPRIFFLPGVEGISSVFNILTAKLSCDAYGLQYCPQFQYKSITETAQSLLQYIDIDKNNKTDAFKIVGYSFGVIVALEMAAILEKSGLRGQLVLIDGSPEFSKKISSQQLQMDTEAMFETSLLCVIMATYLPAKKINMLKTDIHKCNTFTERINLVIANSPSTDHSSDYIRDVCTSTYHRVSAMQSYTPHYARITSSVKLLRPAHPSVGNIAHDYGLGQLVAKPVQVLCYDGDHYTILGNDSVAEEIAGSFAREAVYNKQPVGLGLFAGQLIEEEQEGKDGIRIV